MNATMQTDVPFIRVSKAVKHFGVFTALTDVSVEVGKGQAVTLIGPSGSGKSTLLRCMNALEHLNEGSIVIDGEEIGARLDRSGQRRPLSAEKQARQRESIGMVFQSFNLFPHMTAIENVMSGPRLVRKVSMTAARDRAEALLNRVGLSDKAGHYPRQLSGGQQQRVAIARALAMEPKVMLFDEPTSALDPETVQEVLNVIREVRDSGMTMLIATHEMEFARHASDATIFMEGGRIIEYGPSGQVLESPKTERCRKFLSGLTEVPSQITAP